MGDVVAAVQELLPFLALGLVLVLVVTGLVFSRRTRAGDTDALGKTVADGLLLMALMGILVVTLVASAPRLGERPANFVPFRSISQLVSSSVDATIPLRNIVLNVALFVPFGFFFALRWAKPNLLIRAGLAGLCVAIAIEAIQFVALPGRVVDIDDVILNVTGTLIGAGALNAIRGLRARKAA